MTSRGTGCGPILAFFGAIVVGIALTLVFIRPWDFEPVPQTTTTVEETRNQ